MRNRTPTMHLMIQHLCRQYFCNEDQLLELLALEHWSKILPPDEKRDERIMAKAQSMLESFLSVETVETDEVNPAILHSREHGHVTVLLGGEPGWRCEGCDARSPSWQKV